MAKSFLKSNSWFHIGIILLLIFSSRYELLFSPYSVLNGDECVLGLMSKHLLEGQELPIYFYGQSYGFSLIEVLFISMVFAINGISDLSLNIGMLILWSIGIITLYHLLVSICKSKNAGLLALGVCLIFVLSPSWLNYSMQARGGYVTAFSLSFILLYVVRNHHSMISAFSSAVVLIMIYESQALWIPPLIPMMLAFMWKNQKGKYWIGFVVGLIFSIIGFYLLKESLPNFWRPSVFKFDFATFGHNLSSFGSYLEVNLNGLYYLEMAKEAPAIVNIYSAIFGLLILVSFIYLVIRIIKKRENYWMDILFLISVFSSLFLILFINHFSARYLLPFSCFAVFAIHRYLSKQSGFVKIPWIISMLFIGPFVISVYTESFYPKNEKAEIKELLSELKENNTTHVFTTGPLLQWQLMFYSNESVICRFRSKTDRYPAYVEEVNEAHQKAVPTALISKKDRLKDAEPDWISNSGSFAIIFGPNQEELKANKFKFD